MFNWFYAEYLSQASEDWYLVFHMQYVHPNLRRILVTQLRISLISPKLNSNPSYNVSYKVSLNACTCSASSFSQFSR